MPPLGSAVCTVRQKYFCDPRNWRVTLADNRMTGEATVRHQHSEDVDESPPSDQLDPEGVASEPEKKMTDSGV